MKTRSNMPLFVLECENIKALSNSQIDLLRCGDYLVKKDASGEHAYKVTFKSDTGMCLTYHDASVVETQSYDKVGGNWVYNSEDKTPNLLELQNVEDAPDGTINKALGLDSNGDLVKGIISGGTKLYKHKLSMTTNFSVGGSTITYLVLCLVKNDNVVIDRNNMSTKLNGVLSFGFNDENRIGTSGASALPFIPIFVECMSNGTINFNGVPLANIGSVNANTIFSVYMGTVSEITDTVTEL